MSDIKIRDFAMSREIRYFLLALIISLAIFGCFWYGGHTACKLGGGFYYKFACVDLQIVDVPNPDSGYMYSPLPDCSCAVVKDNQVYCSLENLGKD